MTQPRSIDVIVIGGGLAGLSCAVALSDAGLAVLVLEEAAEAGGRARSWRHEISNDTVDIGPHVVHTGYSNFLSFLQRLGSRSHICWQPRPLVTLVTPRGAHTLRRSALPAPLYLLPDMARAPGLSLRDTLSNVHVTRCALAFSEADVSALDSLSGLDLLRRCGTTPAMVDWFWRLASMAVMNVPIELCSAAALMRVHSQLIGSRATYFGFPTCGLSQLYIPQSLSRISARGGAVLMNARITATHHQPRNHVVRCADGREFAAAHCVYAVPPAALGCLQPDLANAAAFVPSPYKSVYLWLDRRITQERFWALLWRPDRLNCDFYDLSNIRPSPPGAPSVIASNIIYSHRAAGFSDEALVRATLREVAEFAPEVRAARVLHADVHHIEMAIPCPLVGTETQRPGTVTRLPGVFLAGDWTRTALPCSMESAVKSGFLAAEEVLRATGRECAVVVPRKPADALARWMGARRPRAQWASRGKKKAGHLA